MQWKKPAWERGYLTPHTKIQLLAMIFMFSPKLITSNILSDLSSAAVQNRSPSALTDTSTIFPKKQKKKDVKRVHRLVHNSTCCINYLAYTCTVHALFT